MENNKICCHCGINQACSNAYPTCPPCVIEVKKQLKIKLLKLLEPYKGQGIGDITDLDGACINASIHDFIKNEM